MAKPWDAVTEAHLVDKYKLGTPVGLEQWRELYSTLGQTREDHQEVGNFLMYDTIDNEMVAIERLVWKMGAILGDEPYT